MSFQRRLASGEFVVLAEMNTPKGVDVSELVANARKIKGRVDGVIIPDMDNGVMRMSALAGGALIHQQGMEAMIHLYGRDRNRMALQGDVLAYGLSGEDQQHRSVSSSSHARRGISASSATATCRRSRARARGPRPRAGGAAVARRVRRVASRPAEELAVEGVEALNESGVLARDRRLPAPALQETADRYVRHRRARDRVESCNQPAPVGAGG